MEYMIGGDMVGDIDHLASVSEQNEAVRRADAYIRNSGRPKLIADWDAMPPEHKLICAEATILAMKQSRDQNTPYNEDATS